MTANAYLQRNLQGSSEEKNFVFPVNVLRSQGYKITIAPGPTCRKALGRVIFLESTVPDPTCPQGLGPGYFFMDSLQVTHAD